MLLALKARLRRRPVLHRSPLASVAAVGEVSGKDSKAATWSGDSDPGAEVGEDLSECCWRRGELSDIKSKIRTFAEDI